MGTYDQEDQTAENILRVLPPPPFGATTCVTNGNFADDQALWLQARRLVEDDSIDRQSWNDGVAANAKKKNWVLMRIMSPNGIICMSSRSLKAGSVCWRFGCCGCLPSFLPTPPPPSLSLTSGEPSAQPRPSDQIARLLTTQGPDLLSDSVV